MDTKEWRNRYKNRNDISSRLTHLTKGDTPDEAFKTLLKILKKKKLIGSTTETGFIIGNRPAVCLQETPLNALAENLLYEDKLVEENNGKVHYRAFGLRFNKVWVYNMGGRPVIYEEKDTMKRLLPEEEHWRIVNYDLKNKKYMIDWSHEREWRVPENLEFNYNNIEVVVESGKYYQEFIQYCLKHRKTNILKEINGIVVLNTIFF